MQMATSKIQVPVHSSFHRQPAVHKLGPCVQQIDYE